MFVAFRLYAHSGSEVPEDTLECELSRLEETEVLKFEVKKFLLKMSRTMRKKHVR